MATLDHLMPQVPLDPLDEAKQNAGESDSESEQDANVQIPKDSERRRAQNARFSAWLSQRAEKITKEEVQAVVENANEETLSIRSLMAKQESHMIITTPREYQLELFERAKNQNIIAVLDTGQQHWHHRCIAADGLV